VRLVKSGYFSIILLTSAEVGTLTDLKASASSFRIIEISADVHFTRNPERKLHLIKICTPIVIEHLYSTTQSQYHVGGSK